MKVNHARLHLEALGMERMIRLEQDRHDDRVKQKPLFLVVWPVDRLALISRTRSRNASTSSGCLNLCRGESTPGVRSWNGTRPLGRAPRIDDHSRHT